MRLQPGAECGIQCDETAAAVFIIIKECVTECNGVAHWCVCNPFLSTWSSETHRGPVTLTKLVDWIDS